MKLYIKRLGYLALALILCTANARAQYGQLTVPPELQLTIMIRTTLIAYNHANQTGNYSVLRDLGSPSFQQANTQARLAEIFRDERMRNVDLSAVVVLQPKLLQPAAIDKDGRLVLIGLFDSKPEQVRFTIAFEPAGRLWRLYALGVKTGRPEPASPAKSKEPKTSKPQPEAKKSRKSK